MVSLPDVVYSQVVIKSQKLTYLNYLEYNQFGEAHLYLSEVFD